MRCIRGRVAMVRALTWLGVLGAMIISAAVRAENWTQFRGPTGSGAIEEKQAPAEWDKDKNIQWKAKVPGYAWSSPVIWGDKVFVTTAVSDNQKKPGGG